MPNTKIPGFIDLQVNGYKGVGFSGPELTAESFCFACEELFNNGTACFLPTIITSPRPIYIRNLHIIGKVINNGKFGSRVPGIHLEGPFISDKPGAVGAHNPDWTREPDIEFFEQLQDLAHGHIKLITIAAEIANAAEFTKYLVGKNVVVSLGHQMADYQEMKKLFDAGAKSVTHLGNGMPNEVHRHHNQIMAALAVKNLKAMIITDGHHLPEQVIRTIFNAKNIGDIIVTSDASPIAGLEPGKYCVLGNDVVLEESGLLHNPSKQCLVGSSATMIECMNYLAGLDILTAQQLIKVGFDNPLGLMNIDKNTIDSDSAVEWNESNKKFEIVK